MGFFIIKVELVSLKIETKTQEVDHVTFSILAPAIEQRRRWIKKAVGYHEARYYEKRINRVKGKWKRDSEEG